MEFAIQTGPMGERFLNRDSDFLVIFIAAHQTVSCEYPAGVCPDDKDRAV